MKTFSEYLDGHSGEIELLESSFNRIHQHIRDRNIGFISAQRGVDHNASKAEQITQHRRNNEAHENLKKDLKKHGFGYVHVNGAYTENKGTPHEKEVKEKSFMVIGDKTDAGHKKLHDFMTKHGEKYEQDSVAIKKHNEKHASLVGTTHRDGAWIKHGEHHNIGEFKHGTESEFYSRMKNKGNRGFHFKEEYEVSIQTPTGFYQRYPLSLRDKEYNF